MMAYNYRQVRQICFDEGILLEDDNPQRIICHCPRKQSQASAQYLGDRRWKGEISDGDTGWMVWGRKGQVIFWLIDAILHGPTPPKPGLWLEYDTFTRERQSSATAD